jgi:hypothetical protein
MNAKITAVWYLGTTFDQLTLSCLDAGGLGKSFLSWCAVKWKHQQECLRLRELETLVMAGRSHRSP